MESYEVRNRAVLLALWLVVAALALARAVVSVAVRVLEVVGPQAYRLAARVADLVAQVDQVMDPMPEPPSPAGPGGAGAHVIDGKVVSSRVERDMAA